MTEWRNKEGNDKKEIIMIQGGCQNKKESSVKKGKKGGNNEWQNMGGNTG